MKRIHYVDTATKGHILLFKHISTFCYVNPNVQWHNKYEKTLPKQTNDMYLSLYMNSRNDIFLTRFFNTIHTNDLMTPVWQVSCLVHNSIHMYTFLCETTSEALKLESKYSSILFLVKCILHQLKLTITAVE